jgi:hypothetical protein
MRSRVRKLSKRKDRLEKESARLFLNANAFVSFVQLSLCVNVYAFKMSQLYAHI